jgi:hypothetical protein
MFGRKLFGLIGAFLLTSLPANGATHKGVCLDHAEYTATARCVTSDQIFEKVSVKFERDSIKIYFDDGGHITLKLESEEISNPRHVVAHVTDKGYETVTWIIELSDLKLSTPPSEPEPS